MKPEKIKQMIVDGEIIITTKQLIKKAVESSITGLYKDNGEFGKNRYKESREFEALNSDDFDEISSEIIDFLTS